jgi:hypothetical protein
MSFSQNGKQEGRTGPVWGLVPVGGGGCKERVWKYVLRYENGKMRTGQPLPGMEGQKKGE